MPDDRMILPAPAQIEHMAFHGRDANVYRHFLSIPVDRRSFYASKNIYSSLIRGALQMGRSRGDIAYRLIEAILNEFILFCKSASAFPRELHESILFCCREFHAVNRDEQISAFSQRADELGIRNYPDLHAELQYLRAEALFDAGRYDETAALLSGMMKKLYLVPNRELLPRMLSLSAKSFVLCGDPVRHTASLFSGLWLYYDDHEVRSAIVRTLVTVHRGVFRLLSDGSVSLPNRIAFLLNWTGCLGRKTRLSRLWILGWLYLLHGVFHAAVMRHVLRLQGAAVTPAIRAKRRSKTILVTRAMGGVGDLLMMTPGLRALKIRFPDHEIHMAIPARFHALFEGNSDVRVVDIENLPLAPEEYDHWFNLTDCPAARFESRSVPDVRRNRIALFAGGMRIGRRTLNRTGRKPLYFISEEEKEFQADFWKRNSLEGQAVIGIQLQAAESYRDYPLMRELVRRISVTYPVLIFYSDTTEIPCGPNIFDPGRLPIRKAFALAAGCRAIVAPDSAFVHLAGALDLPCVLLGGPVDGRLRASDYPKCINVDARRHLKCVPCWRNEVIPCKLTGMRTSACMSAIPVDEVCRALSRLTGLSF